MLPSEEEIKITRCAHDFARRLVRDETLPQTDKEKVLADKFSEESIRKLLKCLELDLENLAKQPTWSRIHFFRIQNHFLIGTHGYGLEKKRLQ